MNKCCEKWSNLDSLSNEVMLDRGTYGKDYYFSNARFKYCPECGSSLKSEEYKPTKEDAECFMRDFRRIFNEYIKPALEICKHSQSWCECPYCHGKAFHIYKQHMRDNSHQCSACQRIFKPKPQFCTCEKPISKMSLKYKASTPEQEGRWVCATCHLPPAL